jgi:hypothetical protein
MHGYSYYYRPGLLEEVMCWQAGMTKARNKKLFVTRAHIKHNKQFILYLPRKTRWVLKNGLLGRLKFKFAIICSIEVFINFIIMPKKKIDCK